jgi:hypothetical protein
MLTKINTSKYKSKVFGENPHWKVQKHVFFSHIGQIRPENITIVKKLEFWGNDLSESYRCSQQETPLST